MGGGYPLLPTVGLVETSLELERFRQQRIAAFQHRIRLLWLTGALALSLFALPLSGRQLLSLAGAGFLYMLLAIWLLAMGKDARTAIAEAAELRMNEIEIVGAGRHTGAGWAHPVHLEDGSLTTLFFAAPQSVPSRLRVIWHSGHALVVAEEKRPVPEPAAA